MDADGYFYYSRTPQIPRYIYEKTVCGLVDMYAYGGNKSAISYLERITAWAELPLQPDGHAFYYSDYRIGGGTKVYLEDQKWSCCSGTYPQSVADYHNLMYLHDHEGIYVNLFVPSEVVWKGMTLAQETDYPESPTSTITVRNAKAVQFPLGVRIPGWPASFAQRERSAAKRHLQRWKLGESRPKMKLRRQSFDRLPMDLLYAPVDQQHPKRVALVYGPTVLVKRQKRLAADSLPRFSRPEQKLKFEMRPNGEDDFVPFYSIGFHESYEM